ncbi:MAG: hypothetical protein LBK42_05785 [Propionibacteriaceae bacterium]|nr:hypothetical protein [Propionibacteriaceae bacterium]
MATAQPGRPGQPGRPVRTAAGPAAAPSSPAPAPAGAPAPNPAAGAGLTRPQATGAVQRRRPTPGLLGRYRFWAVLWAGLTAVLAVVALAYGRAVADTAAQAAQRADRLEAAQTALTESALIVGDWTDPQASVDFNQQLDQAYAALLEAAATGPNQVAEVEAVFQAATAWDDSVNRWLVQAQTDPGALPDAAARSQAQSQLDQAQGPLGDLYQNARRDAAAGGAGWLTILALISAGASIAVVLASLVAAAWRSHRFITPWWLVSLAAQGGMFVPLVALAAGRAPATVGIVAVAVLGLANLVSLLLGFRSRLREYR